MKLIAILFSTPMVNAILEGRKTQTRRIAKVPVFDHFGKDIMDWGLSEHPFYDEEDNIWRYSVQTDVDDSAGYILKDKYGKVGDVLWVRESFYSYGHWKKNGVTAKGRQKWKFVQDSAFTSITYEDHPPYKVEKNSFHGTGWYKRLARFMPKTACRTWLKIKSIRVERLQDISEEDAIAEGVETLGLYPGCNVSSVGKFNGLWVNINGEESWNSNPWVWVIEFERTEKPEV